MNNNHLMPIYSIKDTSVRRRHTAMTVMARVNIEECYIILFHLILLLLFVTRPVRRRIILIILLINDYINSQLYTENTDLDPVDPANKDRGIDLFSDERCKIDFRFTKDQLYTLYNSFEYPEYMYTDSNLKFKSEYGLLMYLYYIARH